MTCLTEPELLDRCRQGETAAWDELFARHYQPTSRFIPKLDHHLQPDDVEEICQDVFLTVVRNLVSFRGQARFQTWLFRIAINKVRDHQQRQKAAKRGGGQATLPLDHNDPDRGPGLDPPSSALGPDAALIQAETVEWIGQALSQLAQPWREVIQLRYFADLSYDEISRVLNLNPKTVSSRLSKSLDKLEQILRSHAPCCTQSDF